MKRSHLKRIILTAFGAFILAFGLYEVHSFSGVTEGGVLGSALLLENTLNLSPAVTSLIINIICYAVGFSILGWEFILYSAIGAFTFSVSYRFLEGSEPIFNLSPYPLIAAIIGAVFIGVGAGLAIRAGGAPTGDDALAMALSRRFGWKIETVYLIFDLAVLSLSLLYIPPKRLIFSLFSVILSGKIVGLVERWK